MGCRAHRSGGLLVACLRFAATHSQERDDRRCAATSIGAPATLSAYREIPHAQACASCHGDDFLSSEQGPSFLDRTYEPGHPDQAFLAAAMAGVRAHHWDFGNMPRIEGITEEQVLAIVEYVREQQRAVGID